MYAATFSVAASMAASSFSVCWVKAAVRATASTSGRLRPQPDALEHRGALVQFEGGVAQGGVAELTRGAAEHEALGAQAYDVAG